MVTEVDHKVTVSNVHHRYDSDYHDHNHRGTIATRLCLVAARQTGERRFAEVADDDAAVVDDDTAVVRDNVAVVIDDKTGVEALSYDQPKHPADQSCDR